MDLSLAIEQVPFGAPRARIVLDAAACELDERYGPETDRHPMDPASFEPPRGMFLVATANDDVVGGVGVRTVEPGIGEIKRLWVDASFRRRGLARTLMGTIEDRAPSLGLSTLVLETGPLQPEAVALYSSTGWVQVDELPSSVRCHDEGLRFVKRLAR